jgi:hypothetical protein
VEAAMSAPPTDAPTRDPRPEWDDQAADPLGPPESTFWQRYNQHLEFPTSLLISVLALSLGFMLIVLVVWAAMRPADTSPVPIVLAEGGEDAFGDGSPSQGGVSDPIAIGQFAPTQKDYEQLNLPKDQLPEVKDEIKKVLDINDPSADVVISDEKALTLGVLDKELRDKLLGVGQKKGAGPGAGQGEDNSGAGPGGTGPDSTRARSLRWVLRFRTSGGRDYLNQLMSMKAVVLAPVKNSNKQMYIFRDLANPRPGTVATDGDIAQLSRQIQFSDFRRDNVEGVAQALGLDYTPPVFWAFFPAELEADLSRKEKAFRNRQSESIEETIFQVVVRGGQYEIQVIEQRAKR